MKNGVFNFLLYRSNSF